MELINVRAYLFEEKEFYYPEDNSMAALSQFYAVLEGYKLKNKIFELSYGSGFKDRDDKEVFNKDQVEVYFRIGKNGDELIEKEKGVVEFVDGCFVVQNDDGLDIDLATCNIDDKHYLAIIGHEYNGTLKKI